MTLLSSSKHTMKDVSFLFQFLKCSYFSASSFMCVCVWFLYVFSWVFV